MTGAELVSVLIPAWNAEGWIGDAIDSALSQTHPTLEIIVVIDGATDGTTEVVRRYGERLRWESIPRSGAPAARNRLLALARGTWVQYLDADDLLVPQKIERQLGDAARGADLVVSPFLTQSGKLRGLRSDADPWLCLLHGRFGTTTSHLFRRQALLDVGGWDPVRRAAQEQELLGRLLAAGARVAFHDEALSIKRRVNPDSLWRSIWRDDPKAAREADVSVVIAWVRHLRDVGELDARREAAAGARFLRMARSAWQGREGDWGVVLAEAEALGLSSRALLSDTTLAYRTLYVWRGFDAAERMARTQRESRRWLAARRKRLARWALRARSRAAPF